MCVCVRTRYRNIASQTIARLKEVARRISNCQDTEHVSKERSASLDLLLRFQRLLVCKLYVGVTGSTGVGGYSECDQHAVCSCSSRTASPDTHAAAPHRCSPVLTKA